MLTNGDFMNRCIDDERGEGRAIYPGLALHVDPALLLDRGAAHDGNAIEGPHFFVCLWIDEGADETFWVPTSSKRGRGRCELRPALKTGHPGWVRLSSWALVDQVWMASARAVRDAAYLDESRDTAPNCVTSEGLDRLRKAVL